MPRLINQVKSKRQQQAQQEDAPQLEFFKTPIQMNVRSDGEVLGVKGMAGFEEVMMPESIVAAVGFPEADMPEGYEWDSEFRLPIPGFDTAVPAKARNTFSGYTDYEGHPCALIRQVIDSSQSNGSISSPGGALAQMMSFSLPMFKLSGENYIYFDTEIGKIRNATMSLTISLEIGQELDAIKSLIGAYSQQLDGIEGKPGARQMENADAPLMDLGFTVNSSLSLQE
jgi:hypothetical protein